MLNSRLTALEMIQSRSYKAPVEKSANVEDIFASNVFNKKMMKHYLSEDVYDKLLSCIEHSEPLTRDIAGPVAKAVKAWALEKGATSYSHWFQPLTGLAAEKHDAFLDLSGGEAITKFTGDELVQQEPDASSFPNGGLRSTFEARGYTAWDCSSPIFIFETKHGKTLCIPTIFVSYTGEALDYKLPLLRSMALLDKAAVAVCNYFDKNVKRVSATLGPEQEYFLIDEAYFNLRPDLILTGRTVFGASPARHQQLADHYFGSIPERVFAFMNELETEAHKLGIPLKTRHNEVAPAQYECAPRFQDLNVAIDHSLMLMDIMDRTARQHNFRCLLHEKPFAGINGSGKHNNWSMGTDTGKNLLSPGSNPRENMMFLSFFTTVIRAVFEHADLLRASIASAGNDFRLGANEAPPAIMSVFLGSQLSKILDDIAEPPRTRNKDTSNPYLKLGITKIPELLLDNTDRNRTSPFAFTGNKFEFRAVGSSANSSHPMTILNVIVAEQLAIFKKKVDSKVNRGRKLEAALLDVIRENIKESEAIRFEGDGYSDEWVHEAAKRGLSNIKKTPAALKAFLSEKSMKLFKETGLFTEGENAARHAVMVENYILKVKMEADIISELAMTNIVPTAIKYQQELLENVKLAKDSGLSDTSVKMQKELIEIIGSHINNIIEKNEKMNKARHKADALGSTGHGPQEGSIEDSAQAYAEDVFPFFDFIREHVDALEVLLPDETWPMPKYREMLFIR